MEVVAAVVDMEVHHLHHMVEALMDLLLLLPVLHTREEAEGAVMVDHQEEDMAVDHLEVDMVANQMIGWPTWGLVLAVFIGM